MYNNRKVLVAGGTGTIGIPVVRNLIAQGADVSVISMDNPEIASLLFGDTVRFHQRDLTQLDNCIEVTRGVDDVFNLVGIKGSVGIGETKVASYFVPMMWYQTNLMEAAFRNEVKRYLFVSSICGYPQSTEPKLEETFWDGLPKQNDRYPGLAKRIGEVQGETYLRQYGWDAVRVVRPSNVYGPYDDFNPATAQVIPSLISRMVGGENPLTVWGNGSVVRDFIFSEELADWLLIALEKAPACVPINLGNGCGITIKQVAETIARHVPSPPEITWDPSAPSGDPVRILSVDRARELLDFVPRTTFDEGIRRTVTWYLAHRDLASRTGVRYYGK